MNYVKHKLTKYTCRFFNILYFYNMIFIYKTNILLVDVTEHYFLENATIPII